MTKFTKINRDTCIACGACGAVCPEVYANDDEGYAYVSLDDNCGITEIPEEFEEDVLEAMGDCPTGSVQVEDQPFVVNMKLGGAV